MLHHTYLIVWTFGFTSGAALFALGNLLGYWRSADVREEVARVAREFAQHRKSANTRLCQLEERSVTVPDRWREVDAETERARQRLAAFVAGQPPLAVKYATTDQTVTAYPGLPGATPRYPAAPGCWTYRQVNLTTMCADPACDRCNQLRPPTDAGTPIYAEVTATTGEIPTRQDAKATADRIVDTITDLIGPDPASDDAQGLHHPDPVMAYCEEQEGNRLLGQDLAADLAPWELDLLVDQMPVPANPHWACGTVQSPPCPTGEHPIPTRAQLEADLDREEFAAAMAEDGDQGERDHASVAAAVEAMGALDLDEDPIGLQRAAQDVPAGAGE